jgi:hypothetical protein
MNGAEVLGGVAAGTSILNNVIKIVEAARKRGTPPAVSEMVLGIIPGEALAIAGKLEDQINQLRNDLIRSNVDLSKSLAELEADRGYYIFRRNRVIARAAGMIDGFKNSLVALEEDLIAVAVCLDAADIITDSYQEVSNHARELRALVDSKKSIGEILNRLGDDVGKRKSELQTVLSRGSGPSV